MFKAIATIFILMLSITLIDAQIEYNFDDDNTHLFNVEGDGVIFYDPNDGNPGACMRIEEVPNGQVSNLILPREWLGDWSEAMEADFLSFDYYLDSFGDTDIIVSEFVLQIVGEFGTASAIANYTPTILGWQNVSVNLLESEWDLVGGSWEEIMAEIKLVRLRSEYIVGDEYILIDNIHLSISPTEIEFNEECSTFEDITPGSFTNVEGWSFVDIDDYEIDAFGLPENSVKIYDQGVVFSYANAPPIFHGDWNDLEDVGTIEFDLFVETNDVDVISNKDFIFLSNAENAAKINLVDEDYAEAINGWQHFSFPIDEFEWTMTEGEWPDLIDNVTNIQIDLEFIIGNEVVFFDNFCISENAVGVAEYNLEDLKIYPNPTMGLIWIDSKTQVSDLEIYDVLGNLVVHLETPNNFVDVGFLQSGIYFLTVKSELKSRTIKIDVQ